MPPEQSAAVAQALIALRQNAQRQKADAIILTNVQHVLHPHYQGLKEPQQLSHFEADFIRYCKGNSKPSEQTTPYNAQGYRIQEVVSYSFQSPETVSQQQTADAISLPPANISLSSGAFDIPLDTQATELTRRLGPASIEVMLTSGEQALGYGRGLWFIIQNERISSIKSGRLFMSGYGDNLIAYRDGFDSVSWKINGIVPQKASLKEAEAHLRGLQKSTEQEYRLQDKGQELKLVFESFNPKSGNESIKLLTGFTLAKPKATSEVAQPQLAETKRLLQTFSLLNPASLPHKPKLDELLSSIGIYHKLNLSDSGAWWLLGEYLQVQYEQGELRRARLAQNIFTKSHKNQNVAEIIDLLKLPRTKAQMLALYPNAEDNFDQIYVSNADYSLEAKYESESDDADLYQLDIEYF
ncbi:hypothetical protein [Shewanella salipaludis]|uniref:Uncharacterized protein n=1 Tax=Shewanella salipaludis TaxID=2723052 RepID=A0A972JK00_9GAMM|nr:hypothetical protein [Shewanella salipaludis]NMH65690.1 hypothetical protein [Shewanella salipaludis]